MFIQLLGHKYLKHVDFFEKSKFWLKKVGKTNFDDLGIETLFLTHVTKLPFHIKYKTPDTLGVDRIATICAASDIYPNSDVLVIDISEKLYL